MFDCLFVCLKVMLLLWFGGLTILESENVITSVLVLFKTRLYLRYHSHVTWMLFLNNLMGIVGFSQIAVFHIAIKSFTDMINRRGPSEDSWGTPAGPTVTFCNHVTIYFHGLFSVVEIILNRIICIRATTFCKGLY